MSSTYLSRTPASAVAAERRKFTFSCWYKRSKVGGENHLLSGNITGSSYTYLRIQTDNTIRFRLYDGGNQADIQSNDVFRDAASWYHIVLQFDSTQSTSTDRVKIYVNNRQITSLQANTYPSQDYSSWINHNSEQRINTHNNVSCHFAEIHQTGNQIYAPTTFGETDSTTGEWKPKNISGVTFGTNGFHLKYANAGAMGTDSSGNNNTLTVNSVGTNPSTTDTPSNNFATLDVNNDRTQGGFTFSEGSLKVVTSGSNRNYAALTQAFTSGKWYMECRFTGGADSAVVGVCDMDDLNMTNTSSLGDNANEIGVNATGAYEKNNVVTSGWAGTFTTNDVLGLCLDCDNNRFTLSKNGQFADGSGNYDEANPTAYLTYTAGNFMTLAVGERTNVGTATCQINTGNPPYTISSNSGNGNADANGYGKFEYAVPSGYYAVCTRNINTYG